MSAFLFTVGALAAVGIIGPLLATASEKKTNYGSDLEQYIVSQNPCDVADVERLTNEYDRQSKRGYL